MPQLCLSPLRRPDGVRVALIGRLDRTTAAAFTQQMSSLLAAQDGAEVVVLDLRCCTALDAAGVGALDRLRTAVEERGGSLVLERVPPLMASVVHRPERPPADSSESRPL
jgi:anti-anti-sigma factor